MSKIDVSQITGYTEMTIEEKLKTLESFEILDYDYTGYVKKDVFDKTASELIEQKKQLKAKLTEDEQQKQKEQEERDTLLANYEKLLSESNISKNKAKLLALGYDGKLADETADAMVSGDTEKVFTNQKKHIEAVEKRIRGDVLKDTPKPTNDGNGKTMTLEKLRSMSVLERLEYSTANPSEYKTLYGGNE